MNRTDLGAYAKARCPYCLGRFDRPRVDARFCSPTCRKAAGAARAHEHVVDVPSICVRRETDARDRRAATGFGSLSSTEAYRADLRIRALDLGELVNGAQLGAVIEIAGSLREAAAILGREETELRALAEAWRVDEGETLRVVGWSWKDKQQA